MQEQRAILAHYGEIGLKGRNQPMFRRQLRENMALKLKALALDWPIQDVPGFFVIRVPPGSLVGASLRDVLRSLQDVFGLVWVAAAWSVPHRRFAPGTDDVAKLSGLLLKMAGSEFAPDRTFAVRVNRADKVLPFKSTELESQLGGFLRENSQWNKVSLRQPDVTFHIDVRSRVSYLFAEKLRCPGGIPTGTAGRVLALLSGGIDSPVAAYLMAKRGCLLDFLHFTAGSQPREELQTNKAWRLAQIMSRYVPGARLYVVSYVHFDLALMRDHIDYQVVLFRRFMLRVAAQLATRLRARALVTGDNLSQVASQTLPNLVATLRAVEMPVFQPLLGFDKEETMALAKRIGTYDLSIEPYKDCCALISRHPRTSSRHESLEALEAKLFPDYAELIDKTLAEAVCLEMPQPMGEVAVLREPEPIAGVREEN